MENQSQNPKHEIRNKLEAKQTSNPENPKPEILRSLFGTLGF
jgi:hypothetical protein